MKLNSTKPLRQMTTSILSALCNVINPRKPQRICLDRRGCVLKGEHKDESQIWTHVLVRK